MSKRIYKVLNIKPILDCANNNAKLCGRYYFENRGNGRIIHIKSYGSKEDEMYGTDVGVFFTFFEKTNRLEVEAYSYGGMCSLEIVDNLKEYNLTKIEKELMGYIKNLIRYLVKNGIIKERGGNRGKATINK